MAGYVRLMRDTWNDPDWRTVPALHKLVYLQLISQPDISKAGVVTCAPKRWAVQHPDLTVEQVQTALDDLVRRRFLLLDDSTQELMVRTYIKYDEVWKFPNGAKSVRAEIARIVSTDLRAIAEAQLAQALDDHAKGNAKGSGDPYSKGSPKGRAKGSDKGNAKGRATPITHNPEPNTQNPQLIAPVDSETHAVGEDDSADFVGGKLEGKELRDAIWEALATITGTKPATPTERSLHGKAVTEIIEAGGDHIDVIAKAEVWKARFPGLKITVPALLKHWSSLGTFRPNTTWCGKPAYIDPNFEPTDWVPNPHVHFADGTYIDGATNARMAAGL